MASTSIDIRFSAADTASGAVDRLRSKVDGLSGAARESGAAAHAGAKLASDAVGQLDGALGGAIGRADRLAKSLESVGVSARAATQIGAITAGVQIAVGLIQKDMERFSNEAVRHIDGILERRRMERDLLRESAESLFRTLDAERQIARIKAGSKATEGAVDDVRRHRRTVELSGLAGLASPEALRADAAARHLDRHSALNATQSDLEAELSDIQTRRTETGRRREKVWKDYTFAVEARKAYADNNYFGLYDRTIERLDSEIKDLLKTYESLGNSAQEELDVRERIVRAKMQALDADRELANEELLYENARIDAVKREAEERSAKTLEQARQAFEKGRLSAAERSDADYHSAAMSSLSSASASAAAGAGLLDRASMLRVSGLLATGGFRSVAGGYATARGSEMRQEARARKTERYQEEVRRLLRDISEKTGIAESEIGVVTA